MTAKQSRGGSPSSTRYSANPHLDYRALSRTGFECNSHRYRYRTEDREPELEALRIAIPSYSGDGIMSREGAETVRTALAFALESVRSAKFDVSQTYRNDFVKPQ